MGAIIGWDIGGANIKAARIEEGQAEPLVVERPLPLWRELHRLSAVLAEAADSLGPAKTMAVTMTAELADCFANKREGVGGVLDAFRTAFPDVEPWVYGTDGTFRDAAAARQRPYRVAAANWMASATLVARTFPDALFLDVGSTTTDVIPIVGGARDGAGEDRSGTASQRRACVHRGAADARVCRRTFRASPWPPLPRGRRALRRCRRRAPLAWTN